MDTVEALAQAVVGLKKDDVIRLAEVALAEGISPERAINEGLAAGMKIVGERFAEKVIFVPEVLVAGRALYAGMDILSPHLEQTDGAEITALLAVVRGDFHDIGKNIVKLMLGAAGVRVVDIGKNRAAEEIVEAAVAEGADVVGLSTLMTTTLDTMAETVAHLKEKTGAAVLVGGAPVTESYAISIGADGTAPDAAAAVDRVFSVLGKVRS